MQQTALSSVYMLVFVGYQKGLNRFSLRSKKKVDGQWNLYCMVHNIGKIANYGHRAS
jgi:hypothetical protein